MRVYKETEINGFYIDEFGFAAPWFFCYNKAHNHRIPEPPLRGERDTTANIRKSIPPEVAIYTEESPCDYNSQLQDGSFTYSISSVPYEFSPSKINLYRFAFPDFKTFEIITCDHPLGSDVASVKRILFNGEGIWLEGDSEAWFAPEARAFIAKMNKIIKSNLDAFTTLEPIPLIETEKADVYVNKFPGKNKIVFTVLNAGHTTVGGDIFEVDHIEGCRYVDLWNEKELTPRIKGGRAVISFDLGPDEITCIAQLLPLGGASGK
jgi:hypothetical protein